MFSFVICHLSFVTFPHGFAAAVFFGRFLRLIYVRRSPIYAFLRCACLGGKRDKVTE